VLYSLLHVFLPSLPFLLMACRRQKCGPITSNPNQACRSHHTSVHGSLRNLPSEVVASVSVGFSSLSASMYALSYTPYAMPLPYTPHPHLRPDPLITAYTHPSTTLLESIMDSYFLFKQASFDFSLIMDSNRFQVVIIHSFDSRCKQICIPR